MCEPKALIAAKRTERIYEDPWTSKNLRAFVTERSRSFCEWPGETHRGDHVAHIFGKGSGGRRSANLPNNVAWLCVHHHDVLDGRIRLTYDDVYPLLGTLPPVDSREEARMLLAGEIPVCSWYCDRPVETGAGGVRLCHRHGEIVNGEDVPGRRTELGIAFAFVIEAVNLA